MSDKENQKLKVAHRGADNCPENSIFAFDEAWKKGADVVEGDFRMTKDGVVVCIHDEDTLRVAGEEIVISETNYKDLEAVNVGWYLGEDFDERIPTLDQVLGGVPEKGSFLIEVKGGIEMVGALMDVLENTELTKLQFGVISFDKEVLKEVRRLDEQIITLLLSDVEDKISNEELNSILLDIGANGLLTNSSDSEIRDEVESLKLIYNVWNGKSEFEVKG